MTTETYTAIRTNAKVLSTEYTIRIDRTITESQEWHEELETIRMACEPDVIRVIIDTNGGYDTTMGAFLSALSETPAHTIAIAQGNVYSAGGPLLLACDEVVLGRYSSLMIHTGSCGASGTAINLKKHAEFASEMDRKIITECYEGFISDEEIEDVIKGEEIWLNAGDVAERLRKRTEYFIAKNNEPLSEEELTLEFDTVGEQLEEFAQSVGLGKEEVLGRLLQQNHSSILQSGDRELEDIVEDFTEFHEEGGFYPVRIGATGVVWFRDIFGAADDMEHFQLQDLKYIAQNLKIKFAHNISKEKLLLRVENELTKIVAELNK
jgi:ATP-dependent protease ClpP protease subunit